jgi:hypothetical protein
MTWLIHQEDFIPHSVISKSPQQENKRTDTYFRHNACYFIHFLLHVIFLA